MYYLIFKIKSYCGLADTAGKIDSDIFSLNVINNNDEYNIVEAFSVTERKYEDELKIGLKKDFMNFSIVKGKKSYFIMGIKKSHGIMPSIIKNYGIPIFPIIAGNGFEIFNILLFSKDNIDDILKNVEYHNNVEHFEFERITNGDSISNIIKNANSILYTYSLTETEKKILKSAFMHGYFDWPRNIDLLDVAKNFKFSKPTISYHIRNAEKKILQSLIN